jgi:3-hydroxyisobutyrate dehydrogenase
MARNLQAKLPASDTLRVYDINGQTLERFVNETKALSSGASVQVADTVRDAAENSVGLLFVLLCAPSLFHLYSNYVMSLSMNDLSWGLPSRMIFT